MPESPECDPPGAVSFRKNFYLRLLLHQLLRGATGVPGGLLRAPRPGTRGLDGTRRSTVRSRSMPVCARGALACDSRAPAAAGAPPGRAVSCGMKSLGLLVSRSLVGEDYVDALRCVERGRGGSSVPVSLIFALNIHS